MWCRGRRRVATVVLGNTRDQTICCSIKLYLQKWFKKLNLKIITVTCWNTVDGGKLRCSNGVLEALIRFCCQATKDEKLVTGFQMLIPKGVHLATYSATSGSLWKNLWLKAETGKNCTIYGLFHWRLKNDHLSDNVFKSQETSPLNTLYRTLI